MTFEEKMDAELTIAKYRLHTEIELMYERIIEEIRAKEFIRTYNLTPIMFARTYKNYTIYH
ncbi:MAG: hypothetical protein V4721_10285 [Bacteroidota bacterium]